jgi:UDP-N-acetylglucosamine acyltransferase
MSNLVQLAGHVEVEDFAIISGGAMVLQFARIGRNAFIGGMSGVGNDVLPYAIYDGSPRAVYRTINRVGLMRHGFTNEDMHAIHTVYSAVFRGGEGTVQERLARVRKEVKNNKYAMDAIDFIENRSKRGIGTSKNAE